MRIGVAFICEQDWSICIDPSTQVCVEFDCLAKHLQRFAITGRNPRSCVTYDPTPRLRRNRSETGWQILISDLWQAAL
jgi:hypothetical protein